MSTNLKMCRICKNRKDLSLFFGVSWWNMLRVWAAPLFFGAWLNFFWNFGFLWLNLVSDYLYLYEGGGFNGKYRFWRARDWGKSLKRVNVRCVAPIGARRNFWGSNIKKNSFRSMKPISYQSTSVTLVWIKYWRLSSSNKWQQRLTHILSSTAQ